MYIAVSRLFWSRKFPLYKLEFSGIYIFLEYQSICLSSQSKIYHHIKQPLCFRLLLILPYTGPFMWICSTQLCANYTFRNVNLWHGPHLPVAISTTVIFLCLLNKMDSNFTSTRQIPLIADLIKLHTLQFLPAAEYFS